MRRSPEMFSSSSATWMASSRVGASTRPWGFFGADRVTRATMGTPKAMVLPEPVGALPHRSRPASAGGMVTTWMGNASVMPRSASAVAIASGTPREAKVGLDMGADLLDATVGGIGFGRNGSARAEFDSHLPLLSAGADGPERGSWVRLSAPPLRSLSDRVGQARTDR